MASVTVVVVVSVTALLVNAGAVFDPSKIKLPIILPVIALVIEIIEVKDRLPNPSDVTTLFATPPEITTLDIDPRFIFPVSLLIVLPRM